MQYLRYTKKYLLFILNSNLTVLSMILFSKSGNPFSSTPKLRTSILYGLYETFSFKILLTYVAWNYKEKSKLTSI